MFIYIINFLVVVEEWKIKVFFLGGYFKVRVLLFEVRGGRGEVLFVGGYGKLRFGEVIFFFRFLS